MRLHLLPVLAALVAAQALASDAAATRSPAPIAIELNALEAQEGGCRLIFVAQNDADTALAALVLEAVLFDADGRVAALTLLDFRDLPAGRMRVRSFDMAGLDCDGLDRLLINDIAACDWATETAEDCRTALSVRSRVDVELLQ
jgi:hypothetical protein